MAYATITQVKAAMSIGTADTTDDVQITAALGAAEAMIDGYCGRSFGTAGTVAATRVYAATGDDYLVIEDTTAITLVEGMYDDATWTAWDASDWQAEPLNGRSGGRTVPYNALRAVGDYEFPVSDQALVRVTATWGWASVPAEVTQAAIQQTIRLFKRLDTPLGFGGGPDTGLLYVSRQLDGDVAQALAPYRVGSTIIGVA